ncbi:MAG: hypothetical protein ABIP55_07815 [Tepidisphaeraceae bacterium]
MADETQQVRGIHWRETFPFTHLFRAFRIAVHPSKLMLGLIALLCLYAGGRALDGIWPARHLAVPGEVYDYERHVSEGGRSRDFTIARLGARDAVEDAYAQTLIDLNIVTDRNAAEADAHKANRLGEVKEKLLARRNTRRADADRQRNETKAAAEKIENRVERESTLTEIDDAYRDRVREIYHEAYRDLQAAKSIRGLGLFHAFFTYEAQRVVGVVKGVISGNWLGEIDDPRGAGVVTNVINFFTVGPVWLMRHHAVYFVLFTLLFLTVWAIFGGAIARIAAVHVARDEKLSVRAALAFSLGKFLSFVSAPLIPLIIVLVVGLVPLIAGFLASIPYLGPVLNIAMAVLFVLILAAGFVMTLVLLGTLGGFNLMYPTIAAEGSDSFDAISRSFSYVYARPWRMVLYTLVAIIYGALCYLFVRLFLWLMLSLTHHFVGVGMSNAVAPSFDPLWPTMWRGPAAPPGRLSYDIDFLTLRWDQDIAAGVIAFWVYLVVGMLGAFAISFYFTVNTIIYFLMRHEVDATEMDDVYLEQGDEDFADATAPPAMMTGKPPAEPAAAPDVPAPPASDPPAA